MSSQFRFKQVTDAEREASMQRLRRIALQQLIENLESLSADGVLAEGMSLSDILKRLQEEVGR